MPVPYDLCDYTKFWEGRDYEHEAEVLAINKLVPLIKKRDTFADIGGGYGRLSKILAGYFKSGILTDPSIRNLKTAEEYLKEYPNIKLQRETLPYLNLDDNTYNLVLMVRVSHHLSSLEPSIKELIRITKPGGYLILEIANKNNFIARIRAFVKGDWSFSHRLDSTDRRSMNAKKEKRITFVNHHPLTVINIFKKHEVSVVKTLSVSNFRSSMVRKVVPLRVLLRFEGLSQSIMARLFFGPSIFILAQKGINQEKRV